jgi:MerR family transcriptional regulator, thiopeptide resistance regulator
LEARTMGINLTPEERFEVFGDFDPDQYAAEVEERWGDTDAYGESRRRTRGHTKADWEAMKAEGQAATDAMVAAMRAGIPADSPEAMAGAEAHRLQIDRWFYPCSHQMHVGLAEMYLADPRFTATYEKIAPGLTQYLHDAIKANAARSS